MEVFWILFGCVAGLIALILLTALVCFLKVFYARNPRKRKTVEFEIPDGEIYEPFREQMISWQKEVRDMPHEDMEITSFDGLTLHGKYYECVPGAPIELMFHGYRGTAERDLCGGVQRCFSLKRNALIVHQRGSRNSDGHVITFGIKERKDCLSWIDYMLKRFGADVQIYLTGISMGAMTVMMASGATLPKNVIGVIADCGFTSPQDIIRKVIRDMRLPDKLLYPFIRLGAKLYGRFDTEETSATEELKKCRVPVIFFHGESDEFIPWQMSQINYDACASKKRFVKVPEAGHGLCYPVDKEGYVQALKAFDAEISEKEEKEKNER